ncbi:MAG: response regulator [Ignavibacteriae bacterium]|nr:response regulator [Ignavibacteriota bacterium]
MNKRLRYLHLEDNARDAEIVAAMFAAEGIECDPIRVDSREEFDIALDEHEFDLILSDYTLPSFDGVAALKIAREKRPEVPFIFVSGTIGEDTAIESLLSGATDYVLKHKLSRLVPAVQRALREAENRKERDRAEEASRQSEDRYRSLVESARDAIISVSPQAIIMSLNSAFERLTGWKSEEWIGRSFTDIIHPDDLPRALQILSRVLAGETPDVTEYRIRNKSGEYIVGEFTATPQIQNGKTVGLLAIARDMTERKQLEEQLWRAQRMESLGTLAGGIAHDFNNILGIILGHTSLIDRGKYDPVAIGNSTDAIAKAVQRGAGLVRQILTFARKTDVALEPININLAIEELSKMIRETFPKTIELSLHLAEDIPIITMDHTHLHQALLNLCVNARDAMQDLPAKSGSLSIRTEVINRRELRARRQDATQDRYVCVTIADTGTGIDETARKRLFEPFFTTKKPGKGTGLGLAVVYGVVRAHHGFIDVESEVGKGSTFRMYFPAPTEGVRVSAQATEEVSQIPGGNETILLIEDEESLVGLMKLVLEGKGYRVLTAINGEEGLRQYAQHKDHIALVLTDLGLPRLDGRAVLTSLRNLNPKVKVILASGYLDSTARTELLQEGVHHFIQKPYVPALVLRKVREVIDQDE